MLPVDVCYTQRKIQGGVGALRESDDTNFLKPNGQSRNLNIYGSKYSILGNSWPWTTSGKCSPELTLLTLTVVGK